MCMVKGHVTFYSISLGKVHKIKAFVMLLVKPLDCASVKSISCDLELNIFPKIQSFLLFLGYDYIPGKIYITGRISMPTPNCVWRSSNMVCMFRDQMYNSLIYQQSLSHWHIWPKEVKYKWPHILAIC